MSTQPKPDYSFEDDLGAERECTDAKHDYVAGQVFAMTGGRRVAQPSPPSSAMRTTRRWRHRGRAVQVRSA
jgi:hypothetical protein